MTGAGHHNYYNGNNIRGTNSEQIVNPSPNSNPNNNISTPFSNQQSGLSLEPLNSILYNLYPNSRPKSYTFSDSNFTLQQMYQPATQPQDYYTNEYPSLTNQSPLPTNNNISPSIVAQSQIVRLQQSQSNPYTGVTLFQSPDSTSRTHQSQIRKISHSPQSSISTHLRNSSASTKRPSIDHLEFIKPDKPRIATTYWEDETTICYQVEAQGILVSRRGDTSYVNGTKLLNVAGMTRGKRDGILKTEKTKSVVKVGAMNLKGVWIPFDRAAEIARNEGIDELLYPLFVKDLKSFYDEKGSMLKHDSYLKSQNLEDLSNITLSSVNLPNFENSIIAPNNNDHEDKVEHQECSTPKNLKTENGLK